MAVHSQHRLYRADKVRLRQLAGERLIGFDRNRSRSLHAELISLLYAHSVGYPPAVEATEYTTILGIVAAGEGLAVVPGGVRTFRLPGLRYLAIVEAAASVRLVLLAGTDNVSGLVGDSFDTIASDLGDIMRTILETDGV